MTYNEGTKNDLSEYPYKDELEKKVSISCSELDEQKDEFSESMFDSNSSDSEQKTITLEGKGPEKTLEADIKLNNQMNSESVHPDLDKKRTAKSPLIWFNTSILPENTYLGIYRAIFTNDNQEYGSLLVDVIKKKQLTPRSNAKIYPNPNNEFSSEDLNHDPHFFLCMIGGGHFAATVVSLVPKYTQAKEIGPMVKEVTVIAHKTFHRYTTRRKQGGAQSANDSAKGAAHSAGAGLRRYNEQALRNEVRVLLQDWKEMINSSELIFIRATGSSNRNTLFGPYDGQILRQEDPRIRGFPFSTRRATQTELLRSFVELTRTKIVKIDPLATKAVKPKTSEENCSSTSMKGKKSATAPLLTEEEEINLLHTSQIQALIRRQRLPALLTYLKSNLLSPDFRFYPPDIPQNFHASSPLLLASSLNSTLLVDGLLLKGGSDPSIKNGEGKTAFEIAGERSTRQAFRVARFEIGEEKWNWEQSGVPSGISRNEAEARDQTEKQEEEKKEEQRRKAETERLRKKDPSPNTGTPPIGKSAARVRMAVTGQGLKSAQEKREEEAKGLTPEMQMRLERERRARAAEARMKKVADKN